MYCPVSTVRVRKRGAQSVKGRTAQVPNRREARRAAREAARQQRERTEIAERALIERSGQYLADWAPVSSNEEATLLWSLLTAVLRSTPGDDGTRTALTEDDRWLVVAHPPPTFRLSAVLSLPAGHLACENWRIEVTRA